MVFLVEFLEFSGDETYFSGDGKIDTRKIILLLNLKKFRHTHFIDISKVKRSNANNL